MKYTKKQRLEIYKKALDLFDNPGNYDINFLCTALNVASGWRPDVFLRGMPDAFPEIYALKPPEAGMRNFWWPEDRNLRIKKLTEVINKMENELNQTL